MQDKDIEDLGIQALGARINAPRTKDQDAFTFLLTKRGNLDDRFCE